MSDTNGRIEGPIQLNGLRVFISYPRGGHGHTWAERIQARFELLGAEVWRDERSISEGDQNWYRRLEDGLSKANILISVVGDDTAACQWQEREMLRAVSLGIPIAPLRIASVDLPLYIQEKQPIEVRSDEDETVRILTEEVQRQWGIAGNLFPDPGDRTQADGPGQTVPHTRQRQCELEHLNFLVHNDYSDREERYAPLRGIERRSQSPDRALKTPRMDFDAILRAFQVGPESGLPVEERSYPDVLDAYRDLTHRKVRRLAVLGEPGAGKSFSLERIAVEYARWAIKDREKPIPLLVALGLWTRESESLEDFIKRQLENLGRYFADLRDQGRAVLLLDAMNEIPPGQRHAKAEKIRRLAQDERFASVVVSCRERDFQADFRLPFDTLTLQPLRPSQVMEFMRRSLSIQMDRDATTEAEARFWHMAGGPSVRAVWDVWRDVQDDDLDRFWLVEDLRLDCPSVDSRFSYEQRQTWHKARFDSRNLVRLAANPYLLNIMTVLPQLPDNRAELFKGFLAVLHDRERKARDQRHDAAGAPDYTGWEAALSELAAAMQRQGSDDGGAQTALPRAAWPDALSESLVDFSVDASVLQRRGDDLCFTHQLLQEYLASRVLLDVAQSGKGTATVIWPQPHWWERTGWEVVAEIAAESLGSDVGAQASLIGWLASANPDVACEVWRKLEQPNLPSDVLDSISEAWLVRMTDPSSEPNPYARAAIGLALARFGLDRRKGVGLQTNGIPDIDWVEISGDYQVFAKGLQPVSVPTFWIAKYPVTHVQFQAFVDAGGYQQEHWWRDLGEIPKQREEAEWNEPTVPCVGVNWSEAVAFCRWLGAQLGDNSISLPLAHQWEIAARGPKGFIFPWGNEYLAGHANCNEVWGEAGIGNLGRTSVVGLYPQGASECGALDMAGNVWEWCLTEVQPQNHAMSDFFRLYIRKGGSWLDHPSDCSAASSHGEMSIRSCYFIGFRVCRAFA